MSQQVSPPKPAGPTPEEIAAAVLAEADSDPALAGIMARPASPPKPAAPTPEEIAAAVLAEAEADPALAGIMARPVSLPKPAAPTPEEIAAAVLAEADSDPALAGIMARPASPPKPAAPTPEEIAAAVLAEADSDPALAGIMARPASPPKPAAPTPEEIAAAVLAEADSDPALAGIMAQPAAASAAAAEREADLEVVAAMEMQRAAAPVRNLADEDDAAAAILKRRAPMAVPPERRAEAERAAASPGSRVPPNLESFMAPGPAHEPSPHQRRAPERSTRWLRLRCGEQAYALELLKVQEVVLPVPLLPLRGTPPAMLGIMNLRGQVVPVIDLGIHLGASPIEMDMLTRVVVLEENGETLGLRVSAVEDVASLTDQQIEPPDNARICRISNHLFRGVARISHQPMILLDAEQLLH
nr:chemotaxis protein CheW [Xanthomonas sp.]